MMHQNTVDKSKQNFKSVQVIHKAEKIRATKK